MKKIHDARPIGKTIQGPYVCDIGTPDLVWAFRVKLFIKDVVQFAAEVGVSGRGCPWTNPLCLQSHFPHVFAYGTLRDAFSILLKFSSDLKHTVVLSGIVIDLPNFVLDRVFRCSPAEDL